MGVLDVKISLISCARERSLHAKVSADTTEEPSAGRSRLTDPNMI